MTTATSTSVVPAKPPSLPWSARLSMSLLVATTDLVTRRNGTVNRRLLSLLHPSAPPTPNPKRRRGAVRSFDVVVDPARDLWLRLFVPTAPAAAASPPLPLLVFFHGGGFVFLSPAVKAYDSLCRRLARHIPAVVASVNYRLAPEHKCPAAYLDGLDSLRFLDTNHSIQNNNNNIDFSRCFLIGDSAGGNIVHHVAKRWAEDATAHEYRRVRVVGIVAIQPYFGGEERTEAEVRLRKAPLVTARRTEWLWRAFLPEGADKDHEAANVFGRDGVGGGGIGEGFPGEVLVVVGGWDPLKEWQRRYAEGLRRNGRAVRVVEYGEAVHGFYVFPKMEETRLVMEEITAFVHGAKCS